MSWTETRLTAPEVVSSADVKGESPATSGRIPLDEIRNAGDKPVLVFFSCAHDKTPSGKACEKLCKSVFDNEDLARATKLYVCLQVNAQDADPSLLRSLGLQKFPVLAVTDGEGNIVHRITDFASSAKVTGALQRTVSSKFPAYYSTLQQTMAEQARAYEQARALAKAKKYDEAMERLQSITASDVRTDLFDKAQKELLDIQKKAGKG
ncbi:MAG: hypothetical protein HYY93_02220 [Planctomycetes bacterium]|nr:hypothetical protein [Planctomycetota bacterium]